MNRFPTPTLSQTTSTGPKWVPIKTTDWGFIAGVAAVAGLATGLILLGKKK